MHRYAFILAVFSTIASIIEVVCFRLLDFPTRHLSSTIIDFICVLMLLSHGLFVAILYLRHTLAEPAEPVGWCKKAAFDIFLMLVGVCFHFLLDSKIQSLVLATSMSFDALVVSLLLYPATDIGLLDAANGVVLEVAINLDKVSGGYILPSSLLLSATLIIWRACANSKA